MLCLGVGELVLELEAIGGLIRDMTCEHLVEMRLLGSPPRFEMRRKKGCEIEIRRDNEGVHVRRLPGGRERAMEDVADLRDCVCAGLVPSLRAVNLLQTLMQERLQMRPCRRGPAKKLVASGEGQQIHIWLDEDDNIRVKGGKVPAATYAMMPVSSGVNDAFFFEDPLLGEAPEGRTYALMPSTMALFTHVMGSMGLDLLPIWERSVEESPKPSGDAKRWSGMGG